MVEVSKGLMLEVEIELMLEVSKGLMGRGVIMGGTY